MPVMGKREILTGLFVILVIFGVVYGIKKAKAPKLQVPQTPSVEEQIENSFNLVIPEDVERVDLNKVSDIEGTGIATRKFEDGKFTQMILADLPDPVAGFFYQGWLAKGDEYLPTGKLAVAKGGYLLEFTSTKDYSDYKKVVVSLETVLSTKPTKIILEGSF